MIWRVILMQKKLLKSELARHNLADMSNPCCSQRCTQAQYILIQVPQNDLIFIFARQQIWVYSIRLKEPLSLTWRWRWTNRLQKSFWPKIAFWDLWRDYNTLTDDVSLYKVVIALPTCSQISELCGHQSAWDIQLSRGGQSELYFSSDEDRNRWDNVTSKVIFNHL